MLLNNKLHIVKAMLCIACLFGPLKPLTLQLDRSKLLDVLLEFTESHVVLLHGMWFVTSIPQNHATCSYISGS